MIENESKEVEAASNIVRQEEHKANEQAAEAQALKDEVKEMFKFCSKKLIIIFSVGKSIYYNYKSFYQCESDLAEAIPALEAAQAALDTLRVSITL